MAEGESYFASLECTEQFDRFWRDAHNQTRLGYAAFTGMTPMIKESSHNWNSEEIKAFSRYIKESMIVKAVDNFQKYVVEILAEIFKLKPYMVSSSQIQSRILFEIDDLEQIRSHVVEQEATKYSYMNIVDLDEELRKKFSFSIFSRKLRRLRVKRLVEIRNVIVHNRGYINRAFIRKVGSKADKLGERVRLPKPTLLDNYLVALAESVDRDAISKFKLRRQVDA